MDRGTQDYTVTLPLAGRPKLSNHLWFAYRFVLCGVGGDVYACVSVSV